MGVRPVMYRGHSSRHAAPMIGSSIVLRPRLLDRLDRHPTTVVVGSAGYGKTSAVSSWLAVRPPEGAVCWLTVTERDADAARLCEDLLHSLRSATGDPLPGLSSLESPPLLADPMQFVDAVVEALHDSDVPVTLVLDDVQNLGGAARSLAVLDHLVQWAPPSTRLTIVGRTVPRLRLQRLRLEDRLELIGPGDLAFTPDETSSALAALGLELSASESDALHAAAQGWPAAVRMAALAVRAGGTDRVLGGISRDDALAHYLAAEVLAAIDADLRHFLLVATIDELVCPSLLDAVRDATDSAALLERCVEEGLFLSRADRTGSDRWYRWHALFAAQMQDYLHAEDRSLVREGERRAACWWTNVDAAVAVRHALAAEEAGLAGDIIDSVWLRLALDGNADTVVRLIEALPASDQRSADQHLALAFVSAQEGAIEVARVELAAARRRRDGLDDVARARFDIRATVIDLFLVDDRSALVDAVAMADRLLRHIGDGPWTPDLATLALVQLYAGMGHARLQDDLAEALRLLRSAARAAREAALPALELAALAETLVPSIAEGDLESTRALAESVLADAGSRGWADLPSIAPAHGYLGWLALWQGDAPRARLLLQRSLRLLLPTDWGMRGLVLTTLTLACRLDGDLVCAEQAVRQAHELGELDRMPPWWPALLEGLDAHLSFSDGHLDEAAWLAENPRHVPGYNLADCLRAAVLLRSGSPARCLQFLESIPPARRFAHVGVIAEALGAQAQAALGRHTEAHAMLERALAGAARYSLVAPFLLGGPDLAPLLQAHLRLGTAYPEFIPPLLHRLHGSRPSVVNDFGDSLTERELAILRYLATNLSNAEIAEAEFISVNTAKTHIAHVYRKLGVSSRRAAVGRAAELGLV